MWRRTVASVRCHAVASRVRSFTSQHGSTSSDVHTLAHASVVDNIGAMFGRALSRELLPVEKVVGYDADGNKDPPAPTTSSAAVGAGVGAGAGTYGTMAGVDMTLRYKVKGYVSNANYSMKKSVFIVFINDRLVDCAVLKRVRRNPVVWSRAHVEV